MIRRPKNTKRPILKTGAKAKARARRDGKWWAVAFVIEGGEPDEGFYTQGRTLAKAEYMVKDAADLLGYPGATVEWVSIDSGYGEEMAEVTRLAAEAEEGRKAYAKAQQGLVARMRHDGLGVRDIGALLGLTPGRISQIAAAR